MGLGDPTFFLIFFWKLKLPLVGTFGLGKSMGLGDGSFFSNFFGRPNLPLVRTFRTRQKDGSRRRVLFLNNFFESPTCPWSERPEQPNLPLVKRSGQGKRMGLGEGSFFSMFFESQTCPWSERWDIGHYRAGPVK